MIRLALAPSWIAVLSFDLRCATLVLPIAIGRLGSSSPRSLPKQAFNACRQHIVSAAIPIASDAPASQTSRGFLPWRFADAGPRVRRATVMGPASENLTISGAAKTRFYPITSSMPASPVHSGNPAFRRPSVSSFAFDCPPRAIHEVIVKAGSTPSRRAAASRASASRPRWAKAAARQR